MNFLPEDVMIKIYRYKHELEFKHVLDQIIDNNKDSYYFKSIFIIDSTQNGD